MIISFAYYNLHHIYSKNYFGLTAFAASLVNYFLNITQYGFSLSLDQVKVAVNEEYRSMDHVLAAGDEIVFIPPVSGG